MGMSVNVEMTLVKFCPFFCEETVFASLEKTDQMRTEEIAHPQNNEQNSTSLISKFTSRGEPLGALVDADHLKMYNGRLPIRPTIRVTTKVMLH
jgi:hypothetical protein